jgi:hypothetical protein
LIVQSVRLADCHFCGESMFMDDIVSWQRLDAMTVGVIADCAYCFSVNKMVFEAPTFGRLLAEYDVFRDLLGVPLDVFVFDLDGLVGVDDFLLWSGDCRFFEGDRFDWKCGCGRCGR